MNTKNIISNIETLLKIIRDQMIATKAEYDSQLKDIINKYNELNKEYKALYTKELVLKENNYTDKLKIINEEFRVLMMLIIEFIKKKIEKN